MSDVKCIITGCGLFSEASGGQVHGDLHLVGDTYVFNACLDDKGEAAWYYGASQDERVLICHGDFFERRGVIIVSPGSSTLNEAGKDYLNASR